MPTTLNIYGEMKEISVQGSRAVIQAQIVRPGASLSRHSILWAKNSWNWAELSRELEIVAHEQIGRLEEDGQYWVVYKRFWQTIPVNGESQIPVLPRLRRDESWQDRAYAHAGVVMEDLRLPVSDVHGSGLSPWTSLTDQVAHIAERERIRRMQDAGRTRWLAIGDPEHMHLAWGPTESEDQ